MNECATCEQRIEFEQSNGLSEDEACQKVGKQFEITCGKCNPNTCTNPLFPLCEANNDDDSKYCDGENRCATPSCDCPIGQVFCFTGNNPCPIGDSYRCVSNGETPSTDFPLCPAHDNNEDQFCDGSEDLCGTSRCGCEMGQTFCVTKQNPCEDYRCVNGSNTTPVPSTASPTTVAPSQPPSTELPTLFPTISPSKKMVSIQLMYCPFILLQDSLTPNNILFAFFHFNHSFEPLYLPHSIAHGST